MSRKRRHPPSASPASASQSPSAEIHAAPARPSRSHWLAAGIVAVLVGAGSAAWLLRAPKPAAGSASITGGPPVATFIGSAACGDCHGREYLNWSTSQHALAMQHATAESVRGDFNDAKVAFDGVQSSFFKRDGKYVVRTDGPDGKLADFEVKYTFGLEPLQQYLVELPGGRLQALALSWDTRTKEQGGQRWFRQYPNEKIDFRDELHWTRRAQNWNFMCADCHSSQVVKGYDASRDAFETRYNEIAVGCESCHGPGSAHVAWAQAKPADAAKGLTVQLDERRAVSWSIDPTSGNAKRSRERTTEREIEVCAQCHARRAQIAEDYRAGHRFLDHYLPSLIVPSLYYADGQQRDEVFIWGSWLQSRMHRRGVTCSDCHDPHTQKLRAEGNVVCGSCHAPGKYDAPAHHHHAAGSAGARCVDCHMPKSLYMVVDGRRDHSMRVPRPDESVALGVPNACNRCHTDRDARWSAEAVRGWLGRDARGLQTFAPTFHAADAANPAAVSSLAAIANDVAYAPIVRASAIERMAAIGGHDVSAAQHAARDADPLVRLAAVHLTESLPPRQQLAVLSPLMSDPLRAIRIEAARAAAGQQDTLSAPDRAAWQRSADEYVATLRYTADRPEARTALGTFYARLGRHDEAQTAFAQSLALDPDFVPAYLNGADALRMQDRDADALRMLQAGLARAPNNAALHHALGLALVRQRQAKEALRELERAAQLAPDDVRYTYVYAVALNSTGRPADALRVLDRAVTRWPHQRDLLVALTTMQRDAGQIDAARRTAAALAQAYPNDREVGALVQQLR